MTYSAEAGTASPEAAQATISSASPCSQPARAVSATPGGSGRPAAKSSAGGPPRATATGIASFRSRPGRQVAGGIGAGGEVQAEGIVGIELQPVHAAVHLAALGMTGEDQRQGQVAAAVAGPGVQRGDRPQQGGVAADLPAGAVGKQPGLPAGCGQQPRQALKTVARTFSRPGRGQRRTEPGTEVVEAGDAEGAGQAPRGAEEVGQHRRRIVRRPFEIEGRTASRPLADPVDDGRDLQRGSTLAATRCSSPARSSAASSSRRSRGALISPSPFPQPPPPGVAMVRRSPGSASKLHLPGSSRSSVAAAQAVAPAAAGPAALQAVGGDQPALAEQGHPGGAEQLDLPLQPLPPGVASGAAGAAAQPVAAHAEGKRLLQRLHRGIEGVGHVGLDTARPRSFRPAAGAAAEGLVVGEEFAAARIAAADGQVAHGPAAGRRDALRQRPGEGAEEHVDQPLRGLDVAPGDRRREAAVGQRTGAGDHLDRPQAAGVARHLLRGEEAKDVGGRRQGDGAHGVEAARQLVGAGAEVDRGPLSGHGQRAGDGEGAAAGAVVLEDVGEAVAAVGDGGDHLGHQPLAVVEQRPAVAVHLGRAVAGEDLPQPAFANPVGGDLGGEITPPFVRGTHVGEEQFQQVGVDFPFPHQAHGRNAQPLLEDLRGEGHRTGAHAADVGMVGAVGEEEGRAFAAVKSGATRVTSGRWVPPR